MLGKNYPFTVWCDDAVSKIIFPPDRDAVARELYAHMEDHYDDLVAQGIPPEEAEALALRAMGNALEIAPQLAAIHRPFWGYFLQLTRTLLIITLCLTLIPLGKFIYEIDYHEPNVQAFEVFDLKSYGKEGRTLLSYTKPNLTDKSDGYTFTLTDAVEWQLDYTDADGNAQSDVFLYLRMTQFHPLPWAELGDLANWFWAEDSLGNRYGKYYEHLPGGDEPLLLCRGRDTSPFTRTYHLWINDYVSQEAEWIDIRYDRDGRDLVLRIDLTGGETP